MAYESYSVGAFNVKGREIGGEYQSLSEARQRFTELQTEEINIASIVLYGWQEDGTCDALESWAK